MLEIGWNGNKENGCKSSARTIWVYGIYRYRCHRTGERSGDGNYQKKYRVQKDGPLKARL